MHQRPPAVKLGSYSPCRLRSAGPSNIHCRQLHNRTITAVVIAKE